MILFDVYSVIPHTEQETLIGQIFGESLVDAQKKVMVLFSRNRYQYLRIEAKKYREYCELFQRRKN